MQRLYEAYRDRVAFLFVYIREAHPDDEWQLDVNQRDSIIHAQPKTLGGRREIATGCTSALKLTMPCLVDKMDNRVDDAYAAWPERLFIVDVDGRIVLAGGQGPFGFEPKHVRKWLRKNIGRPRKGG